jgi:ferredoxin-NADP reductase
MGDPEIHGTIEQLVAEEHELWQRESDGTASERPIVYVCGPTGFVETAAGVLVALGHEPARIRTERFGPT